MGRQTNDFQGLVLRVQRAFHGKDAKVEESAEEMESDGTLREVDIRVQTMINDAPARILIEARDRGRKQTIQWIDEVIGKYVDIQADQVALVSRTGFTESAKAKAVRHGIKLFTLDEISNMSDWPQSLTKLWIVPYQERAIFTLECKLSRPVPIEAGKAIEWVWRGNRALSKHMHDVWINLREQNRDKLNAIRRDFRTLNRKMRVNIPLGTKLPNGVAYEFNGKRIDSFESITARVRFWAEPAIARNSYYLMSKVGVPADEPFAVVTEIRGISGTRVSSTTTVVQTPGTMSVSVQK